MLNRGEINLPDSYSKKVETAFSTGQLCVGIDPHAELLLDNGFEDSVVGLKSFSFAMLDAISESATIVKPQVAFYERFGAKGLLVLEELLSEASKRKLFVIADAKRGDIGSTMQGYADAWLSKDAPFICDALTVSPYLGVGAMENAVSTAIDRNKGLFVLAATSNREAATIQSAQRNGKTIAESVAEEVRNLNQVATNSNGKYGNLGLVIGATVNLPSYGLDQVNNSMTSNRALVLAPGFGFQGAKLADAKRIFGDLAHDVIYTVSRSALRDGIAGAQSAIAEDQQELQTALAS